MKDLKIVKIECPLCGDQVEVIKNTIIDHRIQLDRAPKHNLIDSGGGWRIRGSIEGFSKELIMKVTIQCPGSLAEVCLDEDYLTDSTMMVIRKELGE